MLIFCSNTDQSKHLETARIFIFDNLVDFVNLRSEKYSESSRIPTMVRTCLASLYIFILLASVHTIHIWIICIIVIRTHFIVMITQTFPRVLTCLFRCGCVCIIFWGNVNGSIIRTTKQDVDSTTTAMYFFGSSIIVIFSFFRFISLPLEPLLTLRFIGSILQPVYGCMPYTMFQLAGDWHCQRRCIAQGPNN